MARIAFAWEFGGSLGHAMALTRLALRLRERGHEAALFLRELRALRHLPEARPFDVFQAPRWLAEGAGMAAAPGSFAEILLGCGYHDGDALEGMARAWHSLFEGWKPDLVVADFAPTALLAARSAGLRRVAYGNGFFTPPRTTPLPPFSLDTRVDSERLAHAESQVLASTNAAIGRIGGPALENLAQLFEADEEFLCTFPELDHYGQRPPSGYWGPRSVLDFGRSLDWPSGKGSRVFVYVQRDLDGLDELLAALAARAHRVIAFIPGLDEARATAFEGPRRRVARGPVRLDRLLPECDLLICHGGELGGVALARGVPLLVCPMHYEQLLLALRVIQLGAGVTPSVPRIPGEFAMLLDRVLGEPRFRAAARSLAQRYPGWSLAEQNRRIVARIGQILAA